nr:HAMP domain-containing sensor histidine kinase [Parabacteroides goldsteinii]
MKGKKIYRDKALLSVWLLCGLLLFTLYAGASDKQAVQETDSLKSLLLRTSDVQEIIPIALRLADLHEQVPEEVKWLECFYREATRIDSFPAVYVALTRLCQYYYNDRNRDSLLYWGNKIDSISKRRNEYPNVLFDFKSYSCQDLLWSRNYEMALNEALSEYRLASELKHPFGLLRCTESLGLIYQTIRRDSDAVVAFQEGLDLIGKTDCPENVAIETKVRLSSYQSESAIRICPYEQTLEILDHYKQAIGDMEKLNKRTGGVYKVGRDYWLLYCFYTDFYVREHMPGKARRALGEAAKYVGNVVTEDDYVVNTYLASQAHYYKEIGNLPMAIKLIDEVFETECIPADLQFKGDILQEQGKLEEALLLYDKLYELESKRNKETFFRQINQLRTLHDLNNQEEQAHEMQVNNERMKQKQHLLFFSMTVVLLLLYLIYILFCYYQRARRLKNELLREKQCLLTSQNNLKSEKAKAEEASRMKSAFVANMSHEIRTPLNAIVGFSGLLVDESADPEERGEYAAVIHNNTEQLLNLVNDVLDLSRMETGDLNFKFGDYLLLDCCHRALDSIRHRIPEGVKLTFTPDVIPVVLHTDMLRLQQILTNLLTNSAKFTCGGEINLAYKVDEARNLVYISVTDTGCGIPKEKQAAVFRRFEKLDDYKSGAGLGLSICTLIADRLGGTLSIDPDYENGARFIFTHPYEILS